MTPERIEEINGLMRNVKQGNLALRDNGISIISELLDALEESQQTIAKQQKALRFAKIAIQKNLASAQYKDEQVLLEAFEEVRAALGNKEDKP